MLGRKRLAARANLMIGRPGETPETVDAGIRAACRMDPTTSIAGIALACPNTGLDARDPKARAT